MPNKRYLPWTAPVRFRTEDRIRGNLGHRSLAESASHATWFAILRIYALQAGELISNCKTGTNTKLMFHWLGHEST